MGGGRNTLQMRTAREATVSPLCQYCAGLVRGARVNDCRTILLCAACVFCVSVQVCVIVINAYGWPILRISLSRPCRIRNTQQTRVAANDN